MEKNQLLVGDWESPSTSSVPFQRSQVPSWGDIISTAHRVRPKTTHARSCFCLPWVWLQWCPPVGRDSQKEATFLWLVRLGQDPPSKHSTSRLASAWGDSSTWLPLFPPSIMLYLSCPSWATVEKCSEESLWRAGRGNKNKHKKVCATWSLLQKLLLPVL